VNQGNKKQKHICPESVNGAAPLTDFLFLDDEILNQGCDFEKKETAVDLNSKGCCPLNGTPSFPYNPQVT